MRIPGTKPQSPNKAEGCHRSLLHSTETRSLHGFCVASQPLVASQATEKGDVRAILCRRCMAFSQDPACHLHRAWRGSGPE